MRSWRATISLIALLATVCVPSSDGATDKVKIIAKDGPFISAGTQLQRFNSAINLTPEQLAGPLSLRVFNGGSSGNKYQWVRVFFNPGRSSAAANAQPSGLLIVDERSFKNTDAVQIDLSGRLASKNLLMIQGAGMPGAQLSYELQSVEIKGVKITSVDPPEIGSGGTLSVHGGGFDPTPSNNTAMIYNRKVTVTKASPTELEVEVPKGLSPVPYDVEISVNGVKSNRYPFRVVGPPEVMGCSGYGLVPGSTVQITGRNFSSRADKNTVTFTVDGVKKKALVSTVSKDSISFTVPDFPELAGKLNSGVATPASISVTSNGVESSGQLNVVISVRPMTN